VEWNEKKRVGYGKREGMEEDGTDGQKMGLYKKVAPKCNIFGMLRVIHF